ncbi:hypothetical protein NQ317_002015 [Molorchus minor]|uniref:Uncharacterized protein n=1 Tax=Molorchus minor TaxID=1323400 RepID=A0ABQ9IQE0_9CUCU|nr:hypothetical protein NQ317_002015 [Molorchus minor]
MQPRSFLFVVVNIHSNVVGEICGHPVYFLSNKKGLLLNLYKKTAKITASHFGIVNYGISIEEDYVGGHGMATGQPLTMYLYII